MKRSNVDSLAIAATLIRHHVLTLTHIELLHRVVVFALCVRRPTADRVYAVEADLLVKELVVAGLDGFVVDGREKGVQNDLEHLVYHLG